MAYSGIDATELTELAADFGHAASDALDMVDGITERAALNVKNTMVDDAASDGHYKRFSNSISYDRSYRPGEVRYEVGPDKGRPQGALGNILYFGTSHNAPVLDIEVGLRAESEPFERHLAQAAEDRVAGRG